VFVWLLILNTSLLALGISSIAIGGALSLPDYPTLISEGCELSKNGNYAQIEPQQAVPAFKMLHEVDNMYKDAVNSYMCSALCICPGNTDDTWYK
jgi:hypothetical protein